MTLGGQVQTFQIATLQDGNAATVRNTQSIDLDLGFALHR